MRFLFSFLLIFSWSASAERICGLYQAEDFGDRMIHSLTDFSTFPTLAVVYTITNAGEATVNSMLSGQCYCILGLVTESGPDPMYQKLAVSNIDFGPFQKCSPIFTSETQTQ